MNRSYGDSLRQQAKWIREALDPATPKHQRISLEDIDVDEIEAAAAEGDMAYDEIEQIRAQVERLAAALTEIEDLGVDGATGARLANIATQALSPLPSTLRQDGDEA